MSSAMQFFIMLVFKVNNEWTISFVPPSLLSLEDVLDVIELVECLHGGEVVDIELQDLVAYLCENGVIELEKVELCAIA